MNRGRRMLQEVRQTEYLSINRLAEMKKVWKNFFAGVDDGYIMTFVRRDFLKLSRSGG